MYRIPGIIVIIHIHFNLLWCCDLDLPGTDVDCGRDKEEKNGGSLKLFFRKILKKKYYSSNSMWIQKEFDYTEITR